MQGSMQGKGFLVNASSYSITAMLNQLPIALSSMIFNPDADDAKHQGTSKMDTGVVNYVSGSNVYGNLCASSELELFGPQFASSGSPRFKVTIDPNRLPTMNSSIYLYIFYNTIVGTNGAGLREGIKITPVNDSARKLTEA